jgi:hypothetical protein
VGWGEDSLPKITEALRTWMTPVWFYEEHASRIFTELQAQEAAWRVGKRSARRAHERHRVTQ